MEVFGISGECYNFGIDDCAGDCPGRPDWKNLTAGEIDESYCPLIQIKNGTWRLIESKDQVELEDYRTYVIGISPVVAATKRTVSIIEQMDKEIQARIIQLRKERSMKEDKAKTDKSIKQSTPSKAARERIEQGYREAAANESRDVMDKMIATQEAIEEKEAKVKELQAKIVEIDEKLEARIAKIPA